MTTAEKTARLTRWELDPSHSLVEFSAKHMMITTVKGRFTEVEGTVTVDEEEPGNSAVSVSIGAASLDTGTGKRDDHLRSGDFLDVENHPTIEFRSTDVRGPSAEPGEEFKLVGELTIRGTTRPVTLDAVFHGRAPDPWGGERASFSATGKLDRRDFGLTWNQALEAGGVLVSNEVRISLEIQAVLQD